MKLVKIKYVGAKPFAHDNVARSGKSWSGHGDVQEVSEAQASVLLKFPDQWERDGDAAKEIVSGPIAVRVEDGDSGEVIIDLAELLKPLEKMSADELRAFAVSRYGKRLKQTSRKGMLDQIEEWELELDPLPVPPAEVVVTAEEAAAVHAEIEKAVE